MPIPMPWMFKSTVFAHINLDPPDDESKLASILAFSVVFAQRSWLGGRLKPDEAPLMMRMLCAMYVHYRGGRLMTMKDAGRAMGVEHKGTINTYVTRAANLKLLTLVKSEVDARAKLLVPTEEGLKAIEQEARELSDLLKEGAQIMERQEVGVIPDFPRGGMFHMTQMEDPDGFWEESDIVGDPRYGVQNDWTAVCAFSETLRVCDNQHANAFAGRASAYAGMQDDEQALKDIEAAIALEPDNPNYRLEKLFYLFPFEANAEYIKQLDKLIQDHPDFARAVLARAEAHVNVGNLKLAMKDFDRLVKMRPHSTKPLILRGRAWHKAGELERARTDFERARQIADDERTRAELDIILKGLGK